MNQERIPSEVLVNDETIALTDLNKYVSDDWKAIYSIGDGRVVKIYRHSLSDEYVSRIKEMIQHPPSVPKDVSIAWPDSVVYSSDSSPDKILGYRMSEVQGLSVSAYFIPKYRLKYAPSFDYGLLLKAAKTSPRQCGRFTSMAT